VIWMSIGVILCCAKIPAYHKTEVAFLSFQPSLRGTGRF
jgi:hypothetical protein